MNTNGSKTTQSLKPQKLSFNNRFIPFHNYPILFNPTTQIEYKLPEPINIKAINNTYHTI